MQEIKGLPGQEDKLTRLDAYACTMRNSMLELLDLKLDPLLERRLRLHPLNKIRHAQSCFGRKGVQDSLQRDIEDDVSKAYFLERT